MIILIGNRFLLDLSIPFGSPDSLFNADGSRESDWIVFMDHEDSLEPHAFLEITIRFNAR